MERNCHLFVGYLLTLSMALLTAVHLMNILPQNRRRPPLQHQLLVCLFLVTQNGRMALHLLDVRHNLTPLGHFGEMRSLFEKLLLGRRLVSIKNAILHPFAVTSPSWSCTCWHVGVGFSQEALRFSIGISKGRKVTTGLYAY
jgi:hypothetical protein